MRASTIGRFLLLASAAALLSACIDNHTADECALNLNCPPSADAGVVVIVQPPPPEPCEGACVPKGPLYWLDPFLVWLGDAADKPMFCPKQASSDYFDGVAPPAAPTCGGCTCQAPTGSCAFPAMATAHGDACPGMGLGTAFDPPSSWDGNCTTVDAIGGGVQSVTVAPLLMSDNGCVPDAPIVPKDLPKSPTAALACWGMTRGVCDKSGDLCEPAAPAPAQPGTASPWTYCVTRMNPDDPPPLNCPSSYPIMYVFGTSYTGSRACSPCTCGPSAGSACSSLVSVYADGMCSDPVGSVTALSSASKCVDMPAASPLGSKTASPPVYEPGTCPASGGAPTSSVSYEQQTTFCCLD